MQQVWRKERLGNGHVIAAGRRTDRVEQRLHDSHHAHFYRGGADVRHFEPLPRQHGLEGAGVELVQVAGRVKAE